MRALSGCAAAMLLAGGVYLNALHNPFVFDDFRTVSDNGSIVTSSDPWAIVTYDTARPLTNLSFALDRALWGDATPVGFHVTNVVLHVCNVALIFALVLRLCGDARRRARVAVPALSDAGAATIAALLFGVHPVMTEAVGYISGRSDLLCASLFLLAVLASRRFVVAGGAAALLAVWPLGIAALLSKEVAVVLPPVVLLYGWLLLPERSAEPGARSRLVRLVVPLAAVMVVAGLARVGVFVRVEDGELGIGLADLDRVAASFVLYARLALIPAGQSIFHAVDAPPAWSRLAAVAILAVLALASVYRRRAPLAVFGGWWFAVVIAPSVLMAATHVDVAVAEHREYLPFAGVAIGAAAAAAWLAGYTQRFASTRVLAPIAAGSIVLVLAGWTVLRNVVWSDPVSLWEEATRRSPRHWLPHAALGETWHRADRHEEAVDAFRASIAIRPANEVVVANLAVCLAELGRASDAEAAVAALERIEPHSPYVRVGSGAVAAIGGQVERARAEFTSALELDPANVLARQWLVALAEGASDRGQALEQCYLLRRLTPGRLSVDRCIARNQQTP